METEQIQQYIDLVISGIMTYTPKVLAALLILWLGFKVLKKVSKITKLAIEKSGLSPEIAIFLVSLLDIVLKALLILVVAGIVGVDTTSFVALIAAAGFAIGLALQGSLANFAAGILIILFKPYKVGDYIEVLDKFGIVTQIQIFNTILESPGNKTHVIPNGKIMDDVVTNVSTKGNIRLELEVTMAYSEDYDKIYRIINEVLSANNRVLNSPEPEVGILQYDSHNIVVGVRPYVLPEDFWEVKFEVYAGIKRAFNENGVEVAYSEGVEMGRIGK